MKEKREKQTSNKAGIFAVTSEESKMKGKGPILETLRIAVLTICVGRTPMDVMLLQDHTPTT